MGHSTRLLPFTLAASFVLFAVLAAAYMFYVQPKQTERETMAADIEEEEQQIAHLRVERTELQEQRDSHTSSSTPLQRELPVVSLTDQFLLDINMSEEIAGVRVMNLSMESSAPVYEVLGGGITTDSGADGDVPDPAEANIVEEETDDTDTRDPEDGDSDEPLEEGSVTKEEERDFVDGEWRGAEYDGMYKQTATMDVRVDTYDHLIRFLAELDQMTRIMNIETIYFTKDEDADSDTEDRMIIDGEDLLDFQVVVSSYYYPALADLKEEAPRADYPIYEDRDQPFLD
ncbi:hypothetical protein CR205_01650 [Alteribacter lacisalsi]|uniref:Pilus assembly protein PilO n=1 Tax=Alteribacter lacisalsi TaxID=2045244 RepID=A0A2W0H644_9BACI|nr:hypothetical protein [Alteribacter lacisalsi]PYZ97334.1 hypothetical protein CR205_01650 [Alteribacter lacisalsi]